MVWGPKRNEMNKKSSSLQSSCSDAIYKLDAVAASAVISRWYVCGQRRRTNGWRLRTQAGSNTATAYVAYSLDAPD